ncbi:hypothetical protein FOL47_010045 [Perkinsus chesapeaki]|uniref:Uncharacterized protein n=1 Tax=Perkinsus chesapeaki TaxID=330153 RepID=A0A7J6L501_PERCH|nr:hypothetical protein FOL47_010045 [Perkinsus chesapeaki]
MTLIACCGHAQPQPLMDGVAFRQFFYDPAVGVLVAVFYFEILPLLPDDDSRRARMSVSTTDATIQVTVDFVYNSQEDVFTFLWQGNARENFINQFNALHLPELHLASTALRQGAWDENIGIFVLDIGDRDYVFELEEWIDIPALACAG